MRVNKYVYTCACTHIHVHLVIYSEKCSCVWFSEINECRNSCPNLTNKTTHNPIDDVVVQTKYISPPTTEITISSTYFIKIKQTSHVFLMFHIQQKYHLSDRILLIFRQGRHCCNFCYVFAKGFGAKAHVLIATGKLC